MLQAKMAAAEEEERQRQLGLLKVLRDAVHFLETRDIRNYRNSSNELVLQQECYQFLFIALVMFKKFQSY